MLAALARVASSLSAVLAPIRRAVDADQVLTICRACFHRADDGASEFLGQTLNPKMLAALEADAEKKQGCVLRSCCLISIVHCEVCCRIASERRWPATLRLFC
jgi:hypothetical protein